MPATFNYLPNRVHKDNYVTDFQQSQNVIKVPNTGTYEYFYWLLPNPVTPLVEDLPDTSEGAVEGDTVEQITYSKLEFKYESVVLLMSGLVPLDIGGFWFIQYPVGFDITVAEQWMIGGNPFIPARAYEYAEEFAQPFISGASSQPLITGDDVRSNWSTFVLQLLGEKYP